MSLKIFMKSAEGPFLIKWNTCTAVNVRISTHLQKSAPHLLQGQNNFAQLLAKIHTPDMRVPKILTMTK